MIKKEFENLELKIIMLEESDIVRTSEELVPGEGDIDFGQN